MFICFLLVRHVRSLRCSARAQIQDLGLPHQVNAKLSDVKVWELAFRFVNAIIGAIVADALTATIVEPAKKACSHGCTRLFTFSHTHRFGYEGHSALEPYRPS